MFKFHYEKFTKSRVEAFSDGVFAIIVTLLVLDLRIPDLKIENNQELIQGIIDVLPKIFIWISSFLITCVIWMNHHRIMETFKTIDAGIFWLNNMLLMATSLIPFPTAMLGTHPHLEAAASFYGICLTLSASCFVFIRIYAVRHPEIFKEGVDVGAFRKGIRRTLTYACFTYLGGAVLSWVDTRIGLALYLLIPLYFIIPRVQEEKSH